MIKTFMNFSVAAVALIGAVQPVAAEEPLASVLMDETGGCMEGPVAQFGRYIGDWDIEDQTLSQDDGETWLPGNGARWNFTCVGNGIAVQDFWMPNGKAGGPAPGVGTNLRIYDATSGQWEIAWTATRSPGFAHIQAKMDEGGNIIMHWASPVQDPPRRITFYPPTDEGWDWLMEMSFDGGESWTGVYKIKATPRQ
ncbi:hypothetical protein ACFO5Q_09540 [Kordiimonas lipolytica]|uniref:DUF1579 domain-containing protein n=1 Tax=Kordiimonas lipolytica TaxID=1662421 RepID=A0ABV8UBN1_9PROT|nr:hypothetical protein [Kordiimonas lipolytica]